LILTQRQRKERVIFTELKFLYQVLHLIICHRNARWVKSVCWNKVCTTFQKKILENNSNYKNNEESISYMIESSDEFNERSKLNSWSDETELLEYKFWWKYSYLLTLWMVLISWGCVIDNRSLFPVNGHGCSENCVPEGRFTVTSSCFTKQQCAHTCHYLFLLWRGTELPLLAGLFSPLAGLSKR
jgi:hypothetical protein